MRQVLGVFYLIFIQALIATFAAISAAANAAVSLLQVYYIRTSTRQDLKYGLSREERKKAFGETSTIVTVPAPSSDPKTIN